MLAWKAPAAPDAADALGTRRARSFQPGKFPAWPTLHYPACIVSTCMLEQAHGIHAMRCRRVSQLASFAAQVILARKFVRAPLSRPSLHLPHW